jgi:PAS domain S-box-containing protein
MHIKLGANGHAYSYSNFVNCSGWDWDVFVQGKRTHTFMWPSFLRKCVFRAQRFFIVAILIQTSALLSVGAAAQSADGGVLPWNASEQSYLNARGPVRMCIDPDWMPYEKIDEKGRHVGMSADYFAIFEKRLGKPVELVKTASWSESLMYGQQRRCDIFSLLNDTPERREFLNFTAPYVEAPIVLVTTDDVPFLDGLGELEGKTLAVPKNYVYEHQVRTHYPNVRIVGVETVAEGLEKVSRGEVYAQIGSLYVLVNEIQKLQLSNLKITGSTEFKTRLAIGTRSDEPALLRVMEQVINSVTPDEHIAIRRKWTATRFELGFDWALMWKVVAGVVGLALLVIVIFSIWNRRLQVEITRRKKVEETLQASEERFRSYFELGLIGMAVTSLEKGWVHVNDRLCEILGYSHEELNAVTWADLTHPDDLAKDIAEFEHVLSGESDGYRMDKKFIRKNGDVIDASIAVKCVRDAEGDIDYFLALVQDITDRKRAEMEMRLAKEGAEEASRAKSEFLASMSHELRTPLNAVLGFAQLMQHTPKDQLSKSQTEYVDSILTAGNHLLELVSEILDLAKIEAHEMDLAIERINVFEILDECIALSASLGKARGIEIADNLDSAQPLYVSADQLRLRQVLLNLISNAVHYNRDAGHVTIDGSETDDGYFKITVTDTGVGIAAKDQSQVFQMFHRLNADPMTSRDGTGIGLTVSQLLIEQMGGKIGFESEVGVGSVFWIEIPIVGAEQRTRAASAAPHQETEKLEAE